MILNVTVTSVIAQGCSHKIRGCLWYWQTRFWTKKKKDFLLFVVISWTVKLFFWLVVSKSPSPCSVSYCPSSALTSLATLRFGLKTSEKTPVVTLFIYLSIFFIRFWDEPNAFLNSKLMKTLTGVPKYGLECSEK